MKSIDLRIGSTYHSVKWKIPVTLEAEDIAELVVMADGANIDHYIDSVFQPIPLTEEWLVKFGFNEKYKSTSNRWTKWAEGVNAGLELHDCEDEHGNIHGVFLHDFTLEVKYVHQLQNLYFALTGEELTYTK